MSGTLAATEASLEGEATRSIVKVTLEVPALIWSAVKPRSSARATGLECWELPCVPRRRLSVSCKSGTLPEAALSLAGSAVHSPVMVSPGPGADRTTAVAETRAAPPATMAASRA